jgi:transposase
LLIKTLLNKRYPLKSHVYKSVTVEELDGAEVLVADIEPLRNGVKICSKCGYKRCPGYDKQPERLVEFVGILGMQVFFRFTPRRVNCPYCGPTIEYLPWVHGKSPVSVPLMIMLSFWSRHLSYSAVAKTFGMSFRQVFTAVDYVVAWGMRKRDVSDVTAIGVDEIQVKAGHKYMTLVYQIDKHCRRLLWAGEGRSEATIQSFFDEFASILPKIRFVCSDMWRGYLTAIKERVPGALNILDRFHIVQNLNKAMDEVRRQESSELKSKGYEAHLKSGRWSFLKRKEHLTENQRMTLKEMLKYNLKSVRAYLLKEEFNQLWRYKRPAWAERFLDGWCTTVMRSKIKPMKKFARSMRRHKPLILNYFKARGELSSGTVEGMNSLAKLAIRKSFGFKTEHALKVTLFHQLGKLPEPELTHRLW